MNSDADAWRAILAGATLGGYELTEFINSGEFGLVFEVRNKDTGSRYAMKVLPPVNNAMAPTDFENEAVLLKKLNRCSSVINVIDAGVETVFMALPGGPSAPVPFRYHVLTLASGSLEDFLQDPEVLSRLSWPERIRLWRGAVKGVHQMHLKLVAHRDLKSSNCLVLVGGSHSEVRVSDLGRSKDFASAPAHSSQAYLMGLGDFRYAPPENLLLQGGATGLDFRNADLYGLGSLFTELTTGQPMTALAMTSWLDVREQGIADLRAGVRRDLATLRPQFRAAIDALTDELPPPIRDSAPRLLTQLCDPVPHARQPQRGAGRRRPPDDGLLWLINYADVLARQIATAPRRHKYRTVASGRIAG